MMDYFECVQFSSYNKTSYHPKKILNCKKFILAKVEQFALSKEIICEV